MKDYKKSQQKKEPTYYIGVTLLSVGSIAILYLALSIVQILKSPDESQIVQWVITKVANSEAILSGHFQGESFEIQANEPFQYVFLCIVGLIIVRILTSIFTTFMFEGARMIKLSNNGSRANNRRNTIQQVAGGDRT